MSPLRGWKRFLRLGNSRRQVEEEVDDEIRFHLETLTDRYVESGMPRDEAAARAKREFGDPDSASAELSEAAWGIRRGILRKELADDLVQDLRLGLRQMRRRPGFAVVVVLTLALGIGANSTIFSALRSVVLAPLPYPEPDRLMTVWTPWEGYNTNPLSGPDWVDLRDGSDSFHAWGVYAQEPMNLSGDQEPEQVNGMRTTAGLLRALETTPALGRSFTPEETAEPLARVALLSHGLWERRFGADPDLLGREILVNQELWTVIGILPEAYRFPGQGTFIEPDLILPLKLDLIPEARGSYYLRALGRLREGVTRDQAHDELNAIAARLATAYPASNAHRIVQVIPLRSIILGDSPERLWTLLGVTGLVLLLACANVGGLLVARNLGRSGEFALRVSLGAGRSRLIRQLLTETLTLALLGGATGLLIAWRGTELLARVLPETLLRGSEIRVDGLVLSATLAATLVAGVLAGVIPALTTTAAGAGGSLRIGPGTGDLGKGRGRLMGSMIAVQFALAFVLVNAAFLMIQSLTAATGDQELDEPGQVLMVGYLQPQETTDNIILPDPFLEELLVRLGGLPGVEAVGATTTLPLRGLWTSDILAEGEEYDPDRDIPSTQVVPASPGYLAAMGIELLRGRDLAPEDLTEGLLGVVVTEAFASQRWPGERALGKRVWANAPSDPWFEAEVVGVAEDVRQRGLEAETQPGMYLPFFPPFQPERWVAIRTARDPLGLAPAVRETLAEMDAHRPINRVFTGDDLYRLGAEGRLVTTRLFGAFALVAVLLAAAGTFGVMTYFVGQKLRDMGIRVALGAGRARVVWLILRVCLTLATIGTGLGLFGLLGVSGLIQSFLYGVGALDTLPMVATGLTMGIVAFAAGALPALRASRANPVDVIRAE